jgi:hypothetical protein
MNRFDLILEAADDTARSIRVFLISPVGTDGFTTYIPAELLQLLEVWRRRFLSHHDPISTSVDADVVGARGSQLCHDLQAWLLHPECGCRRSAGLRSNPSCPSGCAAVPLIPHWDWPLPGCPGRAWRPKGQSGGWPAHLPILQPHTNGPSVDLACCC